MKDRPRIRPKESPYSIAQRMALNTSQLVQFLRHSAMLSQLKGCLAHDASIDEGDPVKRIRRCGTAADKLVCSFAPSQAPLLTAAVYKNTHSMPSDAHVAAMAQLIA